MNDPTLTMALEGDISLEAFATEMNNWRRLVDELSAEVGGSSAILWFIDELSSGSAVATIRGESDDEQIIASVQRAYIDVARSLESGKWVGWPSTVRRYANSMVEMAKLNEKIVAVRFQTSEDDVTITARSSADSPTTANLRAFGAVEGRVQTLSSRKGLRFTLYDSLYDKAVTCYLRQGQESLIEDKWNHRAIVEGLISRDPVTGRPVTIREIRAVTQVEDVSEGSYKDARGIISMRTDEERPEDIIRRIRDAW